MHSRLQGSWHCHVTTPGCANRTNMCLGYETTQVSQSQCSFMTAVVVVVFTMLTGCADGSATDICVAAELCEAEPPAAETVDSRWATIRQISPKSPRIPLFLTFKTPLNQRKFPPRSEAGK